MAISREKNKICWCGTEEFWIQKTNKYYEIICTKCKCHRAIITPGVSVDNYETDVPFQNDVQNIRESNNIKNTKEKLK